jgi:colanic acid biosynthesis glycosyl transferase WcaI
MRLLLLNQPFHPDVVASAQILKDLADDLVARGHHVTVVASASLYGQAGTTLPARETIDGIHVIRVGHNRFGKGHVTGRLLDFASYYLRAAVEAIGGDRYDAVVCLTTPPYLVLLGLLVGRIRASRVVYWLMDVYPDVMVAHGMIRETGAMHLALQHLHRAAIDRTDATVVLGRCMRDRLLAQGAHPERIHVVPVWSAALGSDVPAPEHNGFRRQWDVGDRLVVMYAGNFGLAHDVQTFLLAAKHLREDDRIRFAFVGGGLRKAEVDTFVHEHELRNCIVEGYQPRERLAELLAAGDVHLVTMEPAMAGLVVPSKFYGVAAAGRPCIFIGPRSSEIARVITEWECGSVMSPGEVSTLVAELHRLAEDRNRLGPMGVRARAGVNRHATRPVCTSRLEELMRPSSVARSAPGPTFHES